MTQNTLCDCPDVQKAMQDIKTTMEAYAKAEYIRGLEETRQTIHSTIKSMPQYGEDDSELGYRAALEHVVKILDTNISEAKKV